MAVKIMSATHNNLDGMLIEVEVDISRGLPQFIIVGLPDASVKEAKERVRAAIINSGFEFPLGRIVINLAPGDVRKIGSLLDLPIALGILMESEQIVKKDILNFVVFGELSLLGELKRVRGTIPIVIAGARKNLNKFIFPYENIIEVSFFDYGNYYPVKNLKEVISYITYEDVLPFQKSYDDGEEAEEYTLDYSAIIGHYSSKRALEISAAGKHNVILYGEPGCGKTMLAKAITSILPKLSKKELLEVAKIYSACGLMDEKNKLSRPFRAPHHTTTRSALVGGGREIKAGEITLAHNGVLFLDEMLEFKKETLEALREPLQEKVINLNRLNGRYSMPADFLLIGAFNPLEKSEDKTSVDSIYYSKDSTKKYFNRISSALLDRIDILNYVPRLKYDEIENKIDEYNSSIMRRHVKVARKMQKERFKGTDYKYNSDVNGKDVFRFCKMSKKSEEILKYYYNNSNISLRGYSKIFKIARTISDLDGKKEISEESVLEAINYRKDINGKII